MEAFDIHLPRIWSHVLADGKHRSHALYRLLVFFASLGAVLLLPVVTLEYGQLLPDSIATRYVTNWTFFLPQYAFPFWSVMAGSHGAMPIGRFILSTALTFAFWIIVSILYLRTSRNLPRVMMFPWSLVLIVLSTLLIHWEFRLFKVVFYPWYI